MRYMLLSRRLVSGGALSDARHASLRVLAPVPDSGRNHYYRYTYYYDYDWYPIKVLSQWELTDVFDPKPIYRFSYHI